ncbi:MAG: hypothetical protein AMS14_02520 [Planctomycetes bacterium DG_20]|nr:MAG: hypothetical protein AMS14_02520 [Planctomycetes bacterium DG_20]
MLVNVPALVVIAGVACLCAAQGVYRAAQTLVALVLAAVLAFGWSAPVTGMVFGSSDDPGSVWYYAGDALCLWAILCLVFLGLRTAGERLLPNQPGFPLWADHGGGGAIGLVVGYLAVGICMVLVQMLPVAPAFLGHEPFRYVEGTSEADAERIEPGDRFWLVPDRGVLALFGYLTGGPLGSAGSDTWGLLNRYGDVYPPPMRGAAATKGSPREDAGVTDADDVLYYHWYRRWQYIRFRTGSRLGPIPEIPEGTAVEHALALDRPRSEVLYGMSVRVNRVARSNQIDQFPDDRPPPGEEFLAMSVRFDPTARLPRTIDSDQFHLIDVRGARVGGPPKVHGTARRPSPSAGAEAEAEVEGRATCAASFPRGLRFAFPERSTRGFYLMDGARFHFAGKRDYESRTLVFTIPSQMRTEQLRLFLDRKVPPLPPPPG